MVHYGTSDFWAPPSDQCAVLLPRIGPPPTWTEDGLLRQVVYLGEREDEPAVEALRRGPQRGNRKQLAARLRTAMSVEEPLLRPKWCRHSGPKRGGWRDAWPLTSARSRSQHPQ